MSGDFDELDRTGSQPPQPCASSVESGSNLAPADWPAGYPAESSLEALAAPAGPADPEPLEPMLLNVIFTTPAATRHALSTAVGLVAGLPTRLRLIVPHVVPYALGLDRPGVNLEVQRARYREFVGASSLDTVVEILLCRDPFEALAVALPRESTILVGQRRAWWFRRERRLARKLARLGHNVVIAIQP
jgi:hypothetical protein